MRYPGPPLDPNLCWLVSSFIFVPSRCKLKEIDVASGELLSTLFLNIGHPFCIRQMATIQ